MKAAVYPNGLVISIGNLLVKRETINNDETKCLVDFKLGKS